MKTIALFGGSGKTGQEFFPLALEKGYKVNALARTPSKIGQNHQNLTVIEGDVLNAVSVAKTVAGADIVVSLFGHAKGSPKDVQTKGTANIVEAMHANNVSHILSLSGGGLPFPEKDKPKLPDHIIRGIMKIFVPKLLEDAQNHAEVLKKSGLDWSIVRAPRLTTEPAKGHYREGWVGVNGSTKISRADLASFILSWVERPRYIHQMPFVSE